MPSEGLPVELLPIIVDFLPRQSRLSLRKVGSSLLLHIVNSKLFREINIEIERQKENIKLINLISDSSCSFTSSLQILRVVCRETHIPIDVQTKFDRGIPNLTNVKKLIWTTSLGFSARLNKLAQVFSDLPSLQDAAITIDRETWCSKKTGFPCIRYFRNLSSLHVSYWDNTPLLYCRRGIAPAIKASPGLEELTIHDLYTRRSNHSNHSDWTNCPSFQTFFRRSKPPLKNIKLINVPLPVSEIQESLSRNIKCLDLFTRQGALGSDFAWGELWRTLEESCVELSKLRVSGSDCAMDELFSYLLSFSGLRQLEFGFVQMESPESENRAGVRFWEEIVPRHQKSLTTLGPLNTYDGPWCYA